MDETTVMMSRKRIDFSQDEIAFMHEQAAMENGDRLSYTGIARELNIRFRDHNEGRRTRMVVFDFMTADPDSPVSVRVPLPRNLWVELRASGKKLEDIVIKAVKEALCETSTPPAEPEGAPNAAGSSPSPQTSSTDTGTVFSRNQKKKSGKAASSH